MPLRRLSAAPGIAASAGTAPAPGTRGARRRRVAAGHGRQRPADAKGLVVSQVIQGFLENLLVEGQISDRTLEPPILFLEFLEPFGRISLHAAVLIAPAVKRLLADRQLLADRRDRGAAIEFRLRFTQLGDNLFRIVLLAFHREFLLASRAG